MSKRSGQAKRLLARREALASGLPPLEEMVRGSLVTRYRRCGKASCHCATTEGHSRAPYLVVTLQAGKTEQILLSKEMLPVARRYLDNYNRWWAALQPGRGFALPECRGIQYPLVRSCWGCAAHPLARSLQTL